MQSFSIWEEWTCWLLFIPSLTQLMNTHRLLPQFSRTLWITGILFFSALGMKFHLLWAQRSHTTSSFHCTVIMSTFQTTHIAAATWSGDQKAAKVDTDPKSVSINNAYSAHASYEAFNNSALPWLVALHSIIKSGWQTGRRRHKSDHQWRNLWMISEITLCFMLFAALIKLDFQMTRLVCTCLQM